MRLRGRALALALLPAALAFSACGDDEESESDSFSAKQVVAAYEGAADGYPFEKVTTLVDGAVAYGPVSSADPAKVAPLNNALGDGAVLWQVQIFEGPDPPQDRAAAEAVAFSSNTFEQVKEGIYIGDSDIAYVPRSNVVITGPVLGGDPDDQTLVRWKAVLDGL